MASLEQKPSDANCKDCDHGSFGDRQTLAHFQRDDQPHLQQAGRKPVDTRCEVALKGILKKPQHFQPKYQCLCHPAQAQLEANQVDSKPNAVSAIREHVGGTTKEPSPDIPEILGDGERPCYLPQPGDEFLQEADPMMDPVGPWATGRVDWGPMNGLTGTRPVVDKYSITKFSEGEWRSHNKEILERCSTENHRAKLVDWNGMNCVKTVATKSDEDTQNSSKHLNQRELDIHRWQCELERAISAASEEISFMEEQRQRLKKASSVLQMPEAIAGECLERRTGRWDTELVRDEVEVELIKELALTAEIREIFTRTLKDIEAQLVEDKTVKARLEYDWSDKSFAHHIVTTNLALNPSSNVLMFKPGSVICPEGQSTVDYWEHFTREILQEGEATRQRSVTLRNTLDAILHKASNDLRSQADSVEKALSKRIACNEEVTIRLDKDLKRILQKLANVENTINEIKAALRRLDYPCKLAQTRLDNRSVRPRVENCRDDAQYALLDEIKKINENEAALIAQLKQAEDSQTLLVNARGEMERELMIKRKTLEIDRDRTTRIRSFYPTSSELTGN